MIYCKLKTPDHLTLVYVIDGEEVEIAIDTADGLYGPPFVGFSPDQYANLRSIVQRVLTDEEAKQYMEQAMQTFKRMREDAQELDDFMDTCGKKN